MMRNRRNRVLAGMIVLLAVGMIGQDASAAATEAQIEQTVGAIQEYDYGQSRKALLKVDALVRETHDDADARALLEKELVKLLESDATPAVKQFVCRKLWVIGTDESVPVLGNMLLAEKTAQMACYALASNSSAAASRTLRAALGEIEGNGLIAVINLLGERRDSKSTAAIAKLAGSPEAAVAGAAIAALGKIADGRAAEVLAKLRNSENPKRRTAAHHASLQCALELERRGATGAAKKIHEQLAAKGQPEQIRRAARLGLARLGESKGASGGDVFSKIKAVSMFDGKTFKGWEGNLDWFRIEDGAIVAGTLEKKIPRNEFLCAKKEYGDFELRLKVKLRGDLKRANAGIQIRSRRIPNHHEMIGYQADVGQRWWGKLYDESRRRKVLAAPNAKEFAKHLRLDGWNDYVIRCVGKRIQLTINGYQTVDYTEPDNSIEQKGLIGVQIHSGPPSEAWYKDITIKELP